MGNIVGRVVNNYIRNIKKHTKQFICMLLIFTIAFLSIVVQMYTPVIVKADDLDIQSPSAILMEATTGQIIYEKNSDEQVHPASITKIMTLLLIFDALKSGKISLEEEVTVSEHAASMGGSQVFLESGETQTVNTMIKCISMASANDACVSMNLCQ